MFDRDAVLSAVDLVELADEMLGPRAGTARSPSWRCPKPTHRQTGRTPPLTVFTTRRGEQRWHCHGCGAGGSAIDLVMDARGVDIREAISELARRGGVAEIPPADVGSRRSRRLQSPEAAPAPRRAEAPAVVQPVRELDRYVRECASVLWRAAGAAGRAREWLTKERGLPAGVLRANRVGFDMGPLAQDRPDGLPRVSDAIVLPILAAEAAAYVQLRLLRPRQGRPRYLNPASRLAVNPRVGRYRPAGRVEHDEVIVTEGVIDALSATASGYQSAAILGAGYADPAAAATLALLPHPLVIAFDPDEAGQAGAARLAQLLAARHRQPSHLVLSRGDLNESLTTSTDWRAELPAIVDAARTASAPDLTRAF
jgi:DNA primase